uniref:Golgi membrane protein 2 n=1 Tax=Meloidogyne hapla TaxID=6305 RepID=A0A1I8BRQ5_MELHA
MAESSQNYRRLGRNGHGLAYCSKSSSAFFFLLSIAFVFSIVYLYFSTSSELQSLRNDFENLNSKQLNLKNELLDANVKIEELTKDGAECKTSKDELDAKLQVCKKDLYDKRTSLGRIETNKADCDNTLKELRNKLETANSDLKAKESDNHDQAYKIADLTSTVAKLRSQLELRKSAAVLPSGKSLLPDSILQGNANGVLENDNPPKNITLKAGEKGLPREQIVAPAKVADIDLKEHANDKQVEDFMAPKRQPGGRVHLAEQEEKREKLSNHKELLHAAANLDKQQEVLYDAGAEKEYNANGADDLNNKAVETKNAKNKDEKSVNRPLVDG